MGAPTRFPSGVTTARSTETLGFFGMPDPTKWHVYFNDFDTFAAGEWTITTTEAGSGSATEALTDGQGGLLLVTNDNADNDADFFQKVGESFRFVAGKRTMFKTRFKTSDATQTDLIFGLVITDTTPLANSDGVYFLKADDAATVVLAVNKNSTATTSSALATLADNTFVTLGFVYDGKSEVQAFVDDVKVATLATTNLPDDEDLTVTFGVQNGSAAAKTLTLDYIFAAQER